MEVSDSVAAAVASADAVAASVDAVVAMVDATVATEDAMDLQSELVWLQLSAAVSLFKCNNNLSAASQYRSKYNNNLSAASLYKFLAAAVESALAKN